MDTILESSINILLFITLVNLFLFLIRGISVSNEIVNLNKLNNTSEIELYSQYKFVQKNSENYNYHSDFFFVVQMVKILIYKYLCVLQTCYLKSINIIYQLVTDYFLTFNRLFFESFLKVLNHLSYYVTLNYLFFTNIIDLLLGFPNNVFVFMLLLVYLENGRNRAE